MFISAELEEVLRVGDRVAILRDGRIAETLSSDQLTVDSLPRAGRAAPRIPMAEPRTGADDGGTRRPSNIFDVARLAGVSHQTVSRVLNDLPNVRPATRARVEQAIAQLRYSPSPAARALVTRRTRTIGLVTPGVSDYGPTSIAMHFTFAARAARYSVETISSLDSRMPRALREVVESLLRQRVDAIVLVVVDVGRARSGAGPGSQHPGRRGLVDLAAEPADRVDRPVPGCPLGGSPPGRARPPAHPSSGRPARGSGCRGARARLARRARRPSPRGHRARARRLERRERPSAGLDLDIAPGSAIFVANDHMSIGVLSALRERGLRVPEDVSVVGFDDVPEAGYLYPPLTTVRQDFAALGELIMQKVLIAVEEPDSATEDTPLPTHLIVRKSTSAPR